MLLYECFLSIYLHRITIFNTFAVYRLILAVDASFLAL